MIKQAGTKLTKEDVIKRFKESHGNFYSYEHFGIYKNSSQKIIIICPKHGEFSQTCRAHWKGRGCPGCANNGILLDKNEILNRFITVHGDRYDYSQVDFKNVNTKVKILCKDHGVFEQTPKSHYLLENGCPSCVKNCKNTTEQWIARFREAHGDRYTYDRVVVKNSKTEVKIECPNHGIFLQTPEVHSKGHGCKKCAFDKIAKDNTTVNFEIFSDRANTVHNNQYEYASEGFEGYTKKGTIICSLHGPFQQHLANHVINKTGCPSCANIRSKAENNLAQLVEEMGFAVERGNRSIIPPYELDIFISELNIAIEYCGLRWHGQHFGKKDKNYHLNKLNMCEQKGIELITIFEDEFLQKHDIVKMVLRKRLGKASKDVPARKTIIREIGWTECKDFLNRYHLQGSGQPTKIRYGAFHDDKMVGVMTFSKGRAALCSDKKQIHELVRYASDENIHIGLASKLYNAFLKDHAPNVVVSYADRRWFNGRMYDAIGFEKKALTPPSYWYFKNPDNKRFHRYNFRKNAILKKLGGDPVLTEWENMKSFGYDRIWDCGTIKFEWVNTRASGD